MLVMKMVSKICGRVDSATLRYVLLPAILFSGLVMVWELWVRLTDVPVYILPSPVTVIGTLFGDFGYFTKHATATLFHALCGFLLGATVAIVSAIFMTRSHVLETLLFPLAVIIKVIPVVAIAPLFLIWFGFGTVPIVLIASIITFFPILVNALTGLRSVNPDSMDFFRSINSSERDIFVKLRLPGSLPYIFAAFRITVPLAVIGAFVGELFIGGGSGMGKVIFLSYNNIDMPTMFAAIVVMAFIGISLTVFISCLEAKVLFWHDSRKFF